MPVTLAQPELFHPFVRATQDVFRTMLASSCRAGDWQAIADQPPLGELAAWVHLQGQVTGVVGFHTQPQAACRIVERMTGLPSDALDDLVFDSVREMANMIGGHGKRELETLRLNLGLPEFELHPVQRTRQFREHVWIPFETDLGWCGIDIGFHPE